MASASLSSVPCRCATTGTRWPASGDRVVLRREVMKVKHVGFSGAGGQERRLPHRRPELGECRVDRGEHDVGSVLAVLKGGVHRYRRGHHAGADLERLHCGGVVQVVDVSAGEKGRGVGSLPGRSQRPRDQRDRPAGVAERRRQVARHLRRTATRKEHQAHHNPALDHRCDTTGEVRTPRPRAMPHPRTRIVMGLTVGGTDGTAADGARRVSRAQRAAEGT